MGVEGGALEFQFQGVPVDTSGAFESFQGETSQASMQGFTIKCLPLDYQGGSKMFVIFLFHVHVDPQFRAPEAEQPLVVLVHAVKRRHVETLAEGKTLGLPVACIPRAVVLAFRSEER